MSEQQGIKGLSLEIPTISGDPLKAYSSKAQATRLFLVGANGSGKSALIQHITLRGQETTLSVFRPTGKLGFTPTVLTLRRSDRLAYATNDFHQEMEDQARWTDVYAQQRLSAILLIWLTWRIFVLDRLHDTLTVTTSKTQKRRQMQCVAI